MSTRERFVAAAAIAVHVVSVPARADEPAKTGDWDLEWGGRAAWLERLDPGEAPESGVGISSWGGRRFRSGAWSTVPYLGVNFLRLSSPPYFNQDVAAVVGSPGLRLGYRLDSVEFDVEWDVGISYVNQVVSDTASYAVRTAGASIGMRAVVDLRVSRSLRVGLFGGYRQLPVRPLSLSGRTDLEIVEVGVGLTFGAL